jgi:hypothetical protein
VFSDAQFGDGADQQIKAMPPPPLIEFSRGGARGAEFAESVRGRKELVVEAACGAGKSVDMPVTLLDCGLQLVCHVVPSNVLASSLASYVASRHPKTRVAYVGLGEQCPESGLAIMSSTQFIWVWTGWRAAGAIPEFGLYLDECHEADAAMVVLRTLRSQIRGCVKFLQASATVDGGKTGYRAPVLPSKTVYEKFSRQSSEDWNLLQPGMPWSISEIRSHTLIFEDDDSKAVSLVQRYEEEGFCARRLTARTSPMEFRDIMSSLSRDWAQLMILVVDNTYRVGFTFPMITRIIDTARVSVNKVVDEGWRPELRDAYYSEIFQAAARGGRVEGKDCVYFRPNYEPPRYGTVAEGAEVDGVVMFFRIMGFLPPRHYAGTPFYKGGPPKHLAQLLQGKTPLRLYADKRGTWGEAVEIVKSQVLRAESVVTDESMSRRGSIHSITPSVSDVIVGATLGGETGPETNVGSTRVRDKFGQAVEEFVPAEEVLDADLNDPGPGGLDFSAAILGVPFDDPGPGDGRLSRSIRVGRNTLLEAELNDPGPQRRTDDRWRVGPGYGLDDPGPVDTNVSAGRGVLRRSTAMRKKGSDDVVLGRCWKVVCAEPHVWFVGGYPEFLERCRQYGFDNTCDTLRGDEARAAAYFCVQEINEQTARVAAIIAAGMFVERARGVRQAEHFVTWSRELADLKRKARDAASLPLKYLQRWDGLCLPATTWADKERKYACEIVAELVRMQPPAHQFRSVAGRYVVSSGNRSRWNRLLDVFSGGEQTIDVYVPN